MNGRKVFGEFEVRQDGEVLEAMGEIERAVKGGGMDFGFVEW